MRTLTAPSRAGVGEAAAAPLEALAAVEARSGPEAAAVKASVSRQPGADAYRRANGYAASEAMAAAVGPTPREPAAGAIAALATVEPTSKVTSAATEVAAASAEMTAPTTAEVAATTPTAVAAAAMTTAATATVAAAAMAAMLGVGRRTGRHHQRRSRDQESLHRVTAI